MKAQKFNFNIWLFQWAQYVIQTANIAIILKKQNSIRKPIILEGNVIFRLVSPKEYGKFLIVIFNEWLNDLGDIFIQIFKEALSAWAGFGVNLCVFSQKGGKASVIEFMTI